MDKILITGGSGFIGTHLINHLRNIRSNLSILNIDSKKPIDESHLKYWANVNILDSNSLESAVLNFSPTYVVHLAANTSVEFTKLSDYKENTEGTRNLLYILKQSNLLKHIILTSSQAVCAPNYPPKNDLDFSPNTIYGQSKVESEMIFRSFEFSCIRTIIRPTYVWGPYHPHNANGLFLSIKKGYYCFPGNKPIIRSYGYVKNVVWQITKLIELTAEADNSIRIYYVGDLPINYYEWVNTFSNRLIGRNVKVAPVSVLKVLSLIGDVISKITKTPFLINSYRFINMTEENITPTDKIFKLLGSPPYSLDEGVEETIRWLNK